MKADPIMMKCWISILEKVFEGYEVQEVHRTFCWMLERSNADIPHRQRKGTEGSYEGILAPMIQKEIVYRLLVGDQCAVASDGVGRKSES
jgi:hypothetical protein